MADIRNIERLIEVVAAAGKAKLSIASIEMLKDVLPAKLYEQHR